MNGSLPFFIRYLENEGVSDFRDFDWELYLGFIKHLKEESEISASTGMAVTCIVEEIIRIGQIRGWDVPEGFLFQGLEPVVLWGKNRTKEKVRPIPEDVFRQILSHALYDEKDVLTKARIIIQSQTGLPDWGSPVHPGRVHTVGLVWETAVSDIPILHEFCNQTIRMFRFLEQEEERNGGMER